MKAMATFDTVIVCIRRGFPAGWAKKVKPLATSSTECRVWPILELALGTDHANNSFLLLLPGAESIISGISYINHCGYSKSCSLAIQASD